MSAEEEEALYQHTYERAIRLLARRSHGEQELQRKLLQGKTSREVVARVCASCRALGLLDDAAFALSRTRYRLLHGRYGPSYVRAELRALRVEEHHICDALDALLAEHDVVELATHALSKRFVVKTDPQDAVAEARRGPVCRAGGKKRCYDFLARRGFDDQTIRQVLDRLL